MAKPIAKSKANEEKIKVTAVVKTEVVSKKKLSFKEKRELEELPGQIDTLENLIDELQQQVNQSDFFSQAQELSNKILNQLAESESKLEVAYARWQELDE